MLGSNEIDSLHSAAVRRLGLQAGSQDAQRVAAARQRLQEAGWRLRNGTFPREARAAYRRPLWEWTRRMRVPVHAATREAVAATGAAPSAPAARLQLISA